MIRNTIGREKKRIFDELAKVILNEGNTRLFYLQNELFFDEITPYEVFSLDVFQDENLDIEEIQKYAGKFINLFRTGLSHYEYDKDNEIISLLLLEGATIKKYYQNLKEYIKNEDYISFLKKINVLDELEKRFFKMQNTIFSILEINNINPRPLQVMWSLHDNCLLLHEDVVRAITENESNLNVLIGKYFFLLLGIIEKEELLIIPILADLLHTLDQRSLKRELESYGYSFLKIEKKPKIVTKSEKTTDHLFSTSNGKLNLAELTAILGVLGDYTFVDSEDKVKFFLNTHDHFPRTESIIGRNVRNCHPAKSIEVVEGILESFKNDDEDVADFWINYRGKLLYIRYFAIRNKDNEYLGTLEFTQDITEISKIKGEKRIRDFKKKGE